MKVLKKGIDSYQIKLVAVFCMTLDHIPAFGLIVSNKYWFTDVMRMLGRIAAPLFLFMVAQGLKHTRNKFNYAMRLYIASVICQILNIFVHETFYPDNFLTGNVLYTLFYVAFFVIIIECILKAISEKKRLNTILSILGLLLPTVTVLVDILYIKGIIESDILRWCISTFIPSVVNVDYSFLFVVLGVCWYFTDKKIVNCILYVAFWLVCLFLYFYNNIPISVYHSLHHLLDQQQLYMILVLPFIVLYNGAKGRSMKYFFYIYYPLHQYIIMLLAYFIYKA